VYIGGGTPSVLQGKIKILLDALNEIPFFSPYEFTIEVNPESVTENFLNVCREGGVNRLSLGVQTMHKASCASVNRLPADEKNISLVSEYFPDAFSADLITGLPFQNEKIILEDIKRILTFKPSHVSLYSLTIEEETPLEGKIKNKKIVLPDAEKADSLWLTGRDALINSSFEHYEISNFSINARYCRHNMRYWKMQNWIGAGPSASGTIINDETGTASRYTYPSNLNEYLKKPDIKNASFEEINKQTLMRDTLLMGYRCKEGPDKILFKKRFGSDIKEYIPETIDRWKEKDKMLFLNQFLTDAFKELDKNG